MVVTYRCIKSSFTTVTCIFPCNMQPFVLPWFATTVGYDRKILNFYKNPGCKLLSRRQSYRNESCKFTLSCSVPVKLTFEALIRSSLVRNRLNLQQLTRRSMTCKILLFQKYFWWPQIKRKQAPIQKLLKENHTIN